MTQPMECHCIRASAVPRTTPLYSAFIDNFPSVSQFYDHVPTVDSVRDVAASLQFDPAMRKQVVEVLRAENRRFGANPPVEANLDRLAAGAVAIVTGQQVGLFSGPSYTIYKALTALRLADDLSAAGTPAVPIFWLATEDHDLAEVNHCLWPTRKGPEHLELPAPDAETGNRVGAVHLGAEVEALTKRAEEMLSGAATEEISQALADAYTAGETYGSAFGKLMARLFAGRGLILLDPMSADLHRLAAPLYKKALDQHAALRRELLDRNKLLDRSGYHAQVKVTERSTLLFVNVEGKRQPLRVRNEGFVLGTQTMSPQQVNDLLTAAPESFSPNVLLRPIVQDTLLPTAAYVAGPAEVAYFAQASVVYHQLLGRMPVIMPRASITLVEPGVARLLRKYKLEFTDVLRGSRYVRSKMEQAMLPKSLSARFAAGEKNLQKMLKDLRSPVAKLDASLTGAMDTSERKMLYQFIKLRDKAARALAFRSGVLDAHQQELLGALLPGGELQERSLCFLPAIAAHGFELFDDLLPRLSLDGAQHQVLYL
jgi:bacillithiol biosynthesis cysteine-adding enzyme BshC